MMDPVIYALNVNNQQIIDKDPNEFEERVQVDRKKLEHMISGVSENETTEKLPNAEDFFAKIMKITGAIISWPTRLKIGAKTKKDPFVKICGLPCQVEQAKELVLDLLRARQNRVTLKVDVPFTDHSHIIGRGGKNTQKIMRETGCHIHFPDSNKNRDMEKSNQVSIAGPITSVERARSEIRELAPLSVTFEMKNVQGSANPDEMASNPALEEWLGFEQLNVVVRFNRTSGIPYCMVRGSAFQEEKIKECVGRFVRRVFMPNAPVNYASSLEVLGPQQSTVVGPKASNIKYISNKTGAQIYHPIDTEASRGASTFYIQSNDLDSVFLARKHILGCLPVTLMFDIRAVDGRGVDLSILEQDLNCQISVKYKQNIESKSVLVRGLECNLSQLFSVRRKLLPDIEGDTICEDYDFMPEWTRPPQIPNAVTTLLLNGGHMSALAAPSPMPQFMPPPMQIPLGSLTAAPTPMMISPVSPVFTPNVFNTVSPIAYFTSQFNGTVRPVSGSSSSHVVSGESRESTVLSSLSSNRSSPNEEVIASPPVVQQSPCTPNKSAQRTSLSQQTSPGDDDVNVIVGPVTMPNAEPMKKPSANDPIPENSPIAAGLKNILKERKPLREAWNKAPGAEREIVNDMNSFKFQATQAMQQHPNGPRTPNDYWAGNFFSRSTPGDVIRTKRNLERGDKTSLEQFGDIQSPSNYLPVIDEENDGATRISAVQPQFYLQHKHRNFGASSYLDTMRSATVEWNVNTDCDVGTILAKLNISEHLPKFEAEEIDFEALMIMGEGDLQELGIVAGHRIKLRVAIAELKMQLMKQ